MKKFFKYIYLIIYLLFLIAFCPLFYIAQKLFKYEFNWLFNFTDLLLEKLSR